MVMDDTMRKIFDRSEKAEFLEAVSDNLEDAHRVIICFEKKKPDKMSEFQYYQLGFDQLYEISGFFEYMRDLVVEENNG